MDIKNFLIDTLLNKEKVKPRSVQVQIGPSELGGCSRKVWYRLNEQPETNNNELKLASIMGTAIHAEIEKSIALIDPDGKKYMVETEVEYNGIMAHIDLFIPETGTVVDWKTTKMKNLSYFPSLSQRWQVQTYGYLLEKNGHKVNTVNLVAIARDGDERDVKVHSETYDPAIAEEALAWLERIKNNPNAPAAEKDASYCKSYCKFYDQSGELGCQGLKKESTNPSQILIEDDEVDSNALLFLQLGNEIDSLETKRDSLRASFEGIFGRTKTGVDISWTTVLGRSSIDDKEVERLLGFLPKKPVGKESVRLNIKQNREN